MKIKNYLFIMSFVSFYSLEAVTIINNTGESIVLSGFTVGNGLFLRHSDETVANGYSMSLDFTGCSAQLESDSSKQCELEKLDNASTYEITQNEAGLAYRRVNS